MAIEIGTQLGSHEILSALGRGGMGEVWRARDSKLGREVAIKTLPSEFARDEDRLTRFEREARLLASLNHPNIAAIYGLEESEGTRFLVLELVEGETLAEVIKRGPIPVEEALKLGVQIAAAVEAAHEKGVIHRDLKPANIKITPDGKVKVLDFGLAKALLSDHADISNSPTLSMTATAKGIILGTAAYMSPEQARGLNVDNRTDVWAFGCVLYEMLTGRQAFGGEMVSDILASVIAREPDFAQLSVKLHPRLQETIQRCLEKNPKRRWQAIGDVRVEIERLLSSGDVLAPSGAPLSKIRPIYLATGLLASAILGAAVAWIGKPAPPPEPRPIVRFDFEGPETQNFRATGRPVLAMSPDGRHFAYNTTRGIVLRSMDSLSARIVPGTEDALTDPFFSPNGDWIGYFSNAAQALQKISIAGGAPVTIGPATNPFGVSWENDGTILVAQLGGIAQVSSDGGTLKTVIKLKDGEFAAAPSLLPDGKTVLYTLTRVQGPTRWDQAEIVAQQLNAPEGKVVLRGGADAHYLPTGHLVYAVGNVLFAVAFDADKLEVHGGPVPLVQGVQRPNQPATNTATANFGFSNRGTLVYLNGVNSAANIQSILGIVDRNGAIRRLDVPPSNYRSPRVSPDGKHVAAETISDTGQSIIWVYDLDGKTAIRRLTQEGSNSRPLWSLDSKRILYGSDREKAHGIYSQAADGNGLPERLTTAPEGIQHFPESWSPGGKVLSFAAAHPPFGASSWALWTLRMDDPEKKPAVFYDLPTANEFGSAFSPDGKWIAYASNNANEEANAVFGIYVQPFPPTGVKYEISKNGGAWPVWNPVGGELFYRLNVTGGDTPTIKAVTITTNPVPGFTSDKELAIRGFLPVVNFREYDIMPNGKEFVMVFPVTQAPAAAAPRSRMTVVLNWFEEVKARVPLR